MKNRKWIVAAMAAVLMAGTILSGCNSKKAENSEPETASVIETSEERWIPTGRHMTRPITS